jgi:hypothetical protein
MSRSEVLRSRFLPAGPCLAVGSNFETRSGLRGCKDAPDGISLPDQQRKAANEQTCFFGNKKYVRIGRRGAVRWRGLVRGKGKGGDKLSTCFGVKVSLCEIYFWAEGGKGDVRCEVWKEKGAASRTYTCANIESSPVKAADAAGRQAGAAQASREHC